MARCRFRVWAPLSERVELHILAPNDIVVPMEPKQRGYHQPSSKISSREHGTNIVSQTEENFRIPFHDINPKESMDLRKLSILLFRGRINNGSACQSRNTSSTSYTSARLLPKELLRPLFLIWTNLQRGDYCDRNHAGRPIPGPPELGLRRRLSIRGSEFIWRSVQV